VIRMVTTFSLFVTQSSSICHGLISGGRLPTDIRSVSTGRPAGFRLGWVAAGYLQLERPARAADVYQM